MKILIILSLLALSLAGTNGKCRAIAMAGGGEKGSYEAGVLTTLMEVLPGVDTEYDVISGVSAGSLNGAALSIFPIGAEDEFTDFILNEVWREVTIANITKFWPGGLLEGVVERAGLLDSTPMYKMLHGFVQGRKLERIIVMGTVDANTGNYVEFKYTDPETDPEEVVIHAFASSSIPILWPPVIDRDMVLIDGGSTWNTNLNGAVHACRELGYEDKDIIVDTILCGETHLISEEHVMEYHSLKHLLRAYDI
jgi:NTE family protein